MRDILRHIDLGTAENFFSSEVEPHGVVMVKLTPKWKYVIFNNNKINLYFLNLKI